MVGCLVYGCSSIHGQVPSDGIYVQVGLWGAFKACNGWYWFGLQRSVCLGFSLESFWLSKIGNGFES